MSAKISDRPTFHDPKLQAALEEVAPVIEGYLGRLDGLSEDIKQAEAYLVNTGIRQKIKVNRGPELLCFNHPDAIGCGRIVWQAGNFARPFPLIECKLAVRIRMRGCLPPLLKAAAAAVEEEACEPEAK